MNDGVRRWEPRILAGFRMMTARVRLPRVAQKGLAHSIAHAPRGFYPLQNGGEVAVPPRFAFLLPAARGRRVTRGSRPRPGL